jgi:hypothetical protein
MSSHNDYDRETTTDAHCSETTHLDMAKLTIDEETKIESNLTNINGKHRLVFYSYSVFFHHRSEIFWYPSTVNYLHCFF